MKSDDVVVAFVVVDDVDDVGMVGEKKKVITMKMMVMMMMMMMMMMTMTMTMMMMMVL